MCSISTEFGENRYININFNSYRTSVLQFYEYCVTRFLHYRRQALTMLLMWTCARWIIWWTWSVSNMTFTDKIPLCAATWKVKVHICICIFIKIHTYNSAGKTTEESCENAIMWLYQIEINVFWLQFTKLFSLKSNIKFHPEMMRKAKNTI